MHSSGNLRRWIIWAIAIGITAAPAAVAELYGISRDGTVFYSIDTLTGAATEVADPPGDEMGSLAFDANGRPHAVRISPNQAQLHRFDLAGETDTLVGFFERRQLRGRTGLPRSQ